MAQEDIPGDPRLVAYVVPRPGAAVDAGELRGRLKLELPEVMIPAVFVPLDALPLTINGKLDRRALPAPSGGRPELAAAYEPPGDELERTLAAIWQEVLGLERVGRHDNFFDLGGDSILCLQIVARLHRRGLDADLRLLFQHQTIAALAPTSTPSPPPAATTPTGPPPASCP